jgi:hypothetical protein
MYYNMATLETWFPPFPGCVVANSWRLTLHTVTGLSGLRKCQSRRSQVLVSPEQRTGQRRKLQIRSKTCSGGRGCS